MPTPDFEKPSGDATHHTAKERRASNLQTNLSADSAQTNLMQRATGVFDVRCKLLGERTKIVLSDQSDRGLAHRLQIQLAAVIESKPTQERISGLALCDSIPICSVLSAKAAMESWAHANRALHLQIARQAPVQHSNPFSGIHWQRGIKMTHLPLGVRAAIGAAGAPNLGFLARDTTNSFCQGALDRSVPRLCGPAAKIGAVVRDDEPDSLSRQARALRSALRRLGGCPSSPDACNRRCAP